MSDDHEFDHLSTQFDIEHPVFAERFEDALEHLVSHCPIARSERGPGYHAFNRYADVRKAGQDWRTFSSADGWMMDPPAGNLPILPEDSDPPYHNEWRRVLNPFFATGAVDALADKARGYADELIAGFADRGQCEFVADFAAQLPGLVLFKHILPVPVTDLPELFANIDTYSFGATDERAPAFGRVYEYLEQFLQARKQQPPQNDLVDVLLAGVDKDGAPCPWDDQVSIALDVVFGGLATTTHAMAGAIFELAKAPGVRRSVLAQPQQLNTAVEETVRMYAPVVLVGRTVKVDTTVGGMAFKAGDRVALNFAAASRDPAVCSNPRAFDVTRSEVVHTAFGVGPHRCIGEHMARLEIRVAMQAMLARIPDFEVLPGTAPTYESGQLRTMSQLHLRW